MDEPPRMDVFCDPMMGLLYESEPIMDELERTYGSMLEIRYVMAWLVRDVSDFMLPAERALEPKEGIRRYCARLARIYRSEEAIGGLPVNMEGFRLFDVDHRSSRPLCRAYKAAQLADGERAHAFLRALTHVTVCDCRPTTHDDEIMRVVGEVAIDEGAFVRHMTDGSADAALEEDLRHWRRLGVRSLPAYLIRHRDRAKVLQSFDHRDFVEAIASLRAWDASD